MKRILNVEEVINGIGSYLESYLVSNRVKIKNKQFSCISPDHEDNNPSCSLIENNTKYYCHSCGAFGSIINAYSIFENQEINGQDFYRAIETLANRYSVPIEYDNFYSNFKNEYVYYNIEKRPIMKTQRINLPDGSKEFYVYRYENSEYVAGLNGMEPTIYNYPIVNKAIEEGKTILLLEGEKLVDLVADKYHVVATSVFGGANNKNKYFKHYSNLLKNAKVICIPDNDIVGIKFMEAFAEHLKTTVKSLKIVHLKDLMTSEFPHKGDIEEFIEMNGNIDDIYKKALESSELSLYKDYIIEDERGKKKINANLLAISMSKKYNIIKLIDGTKKIYSPELGYMIDVDDLKPFIKNEIDKSLVTLSLLKEVEQLWDIEIQTVDLMDIDDRYDFINLRNGLYSISQDKIYPHNKDYLSTIQLDVEFNRDVKGENFHRFIERMLPDYRWREVLQEVTGYILSNHYGLRDIFILHGPSKTGKSSLTNLLYDMFKHESRLSMSIDKLGGRFQTSQLFNKSIVVSADITGNKIHNSSLLKSITSDHLNSEVKHIKKNLDFRFKGKLMVTTNKIIDFDESDESVTNRLFYIPCLDVMNENDIVREYTEILKMEKDIVFNWAMEGLRRLIKNNFKFSHGDMISSHHEEQIRFLNPIKAFVDDMIIYDVDSEVTFEELNNQFNRYLSEKKIIHEIKKDRLSKGLAVEIEVKKDMLGPKHGRKRGYKGIKLR